MPRQFRQRFLIPIVGAILVNLVLLVFLTRLSRRVDVPEFDLETTLVTVVATPERQVVEPPTPPPPPKPPRRQEPPPFVPSTSIASIQPIPAVEVSSGPGISIDIPDLNTDGFVFDATDLDHEPRAIIQTDPTYPSRARLMGIEGVVLVRFTVLKDGTVSNLKILSANPKDLFEDAVLETVPRWKYEPGRVHGNPVEWTKRTEVIFRLDG
jgi:protein TonB